MTGKHRHGRWLDADACEDHSEPVSGAELRRLRESHGLDRRGLAERLNIAERRTDGEAYGHATFTVEDVRRWEQAKVHGSFLLRVRALLRGEQTMDNNGVSDESARAQIAVSDAAKTLSEYETLNADAMALAAEAETAIVTLLRLGEPLRLALQARYGAYHRAVSAERQRARLVGGDSNEDAIRIRAWRPIIRVPAGVIANIEINAEYSVGTVPGEIDTALLEHKSPAFDYLPVAEDRPLRRGRG